MAHLEPYKPPAGALFMVLGNPDSAADALCQSSSAIELGRGAMWQRCESNEADSVRFECATCGVVKFSVCEADLLMISHGVAAGPWKVFCTYPAVEHTITALITDPDLPDFLSGVVPIYDCWDEMILVLGDQSEGCGCRSIFGPVREWHEARCGSSAQAETTVICRTCGPRAFRVCWSCLHALEGGEDGVPPTVYCTAMTKPHEVVVIREVKPL